MGATKWWNRIPAILAYPFNASGVVALIAMLAAALLRKLGGLSPSGGIMGTIVGGGIVFAIVGLVIRHSARGSTEFPAVSEIEDPFEDVITPGFKVMLLGILLYLPSIYCLVNGVFGVANVGTSAVMSAARSGGTAPPPGFLTPEMEDAPGWNEERELAPPSFFADEAETRELAVEAAKAAGWLLAAAMTAVASSLLYPLCLIVLAMSGSLRAALYPIAWFMILRQVGLGYLGLLAGLAGGGALYAMVALPLSFVPIPILPSLLQVVLRMYLGLCAAHLLGWFVFQNRERLGIADEPERREVSVAEVKAMATGAPVYRPAGMVQVGGLPPAPAPAAQPYEVPGGPPGAPWGAPAGAEPAQAGEIAGLHARFQAACGAGDTAAAEQSAPLLVDAYWQSGDVAGAAQVYRALTAVSPASSLGPERQGRIAKELETSGDLPTAMTAWRTLALAHPEHPRAPAALWRCAEICEKLGRPDWVQSACQAILARYPMSEVAPLAQSRLRRRTITS